MMFFILSRSHFSLFFCYFITFNLQFYENNEEGTKEVFGRLTIYFKKENN